MIKKISLLLFFALMVLPQIGRSAPASLRTKSVVQPVFNQHIAVNPDSLKCSLIEQFEGIFGNGGIPLPGTASVDWQLPDPSKKYCSVDCTSPPQDASPYANMIRQRCKVLLLYLDLCGVTTSNVCRDNLGISQHCPAPTYSYPPSPCPLDPDNT